MYTSKEKICFFEGIDYDWMKGYERYLKKPGNGTNTSTTI
ncbi:phage integrase SAM-like domain-containing protein [Runella aurantiaca]